MTPPLIGDYISPNAPTAYKYMVSGSISLPSTGSFSFFIHITSSLSVTN